MNQRAWITVAAGTAVLSVLGGTSRADLPPQPPKSVEIRETRVPPKIDGVIEPMWLSADSAVGFVQHSPYEKVAPSERTTVYLMQDAENLYVAFRCSSLTHPPTANLTKDEDYVALSIDPFGSHTTGYTFQVFGSGIFRDGLVLDDGRTTDLSWEGVWSRAVKMYPDRMEVEMKIPFKTIRYKDGLSEWGIQFYRHIASKVEDDYWTEVAQKDGDLISRWGVATDLRPQAAGYYFELYPEGYLRYDQVQGVDAQSKPNGSMNLKWDLTPQTSLNATAYPDFAQIESDPYTLNLSRYPTYLDEQRPFFVEGSEIFRLSGFSNSGFFQPLDIFYSRRIGRSIGGDAVPIIGGLKLTHKTQDWDLGALGSLTDSYHDVGAGVAEPRRGFGVLRAKRRVWGNSDIGILATGTTASPTNYNYAVGTDAVFRRGPNQLIVQGGMSDHDGKQGWALSSGFKGFVGKLLTMAAYQAIDDSFDVQDIGFVPWVGQQRVMLESGPYWTFSRGAVRDLYIGAGFLRDREPGSSHWSTLGTLEISPDLRKNWGSDLELSYGRYYEYDDSEGAFFGYLQRSLSFNFYGTLGGNSINGYASYSNGFNYQRHYRAWQGMNSLSFGYSFIPPLRVSLGTNLWVEWDPNNKVVATWPDFRPRVDYWVNPYISVSLFDEMVALTPGAAMSRARLQSDRLGGLFSWNFAPKSWFYAALNDYGELDVSPAHPNGVMQRQYSIGAVKAKYLLYF